MKAKMDGGVSWIIQNLIFGASYASQVFDFFLEGSKNPGTI